MGSIGKRSGMLMSLVAILEIVSFGLLSIRGEGIDYEACSIGFFHSSSAMRIGMSWLSSIC